VKSFTRVPGAPFAVGAFVLTVLLGVGGVSAAALWQQSATATMTVTANGAWPGTAIASLTCTNSNSDKLATLTVTLAAGPANISYAALQANGTYGAIYQGPQLLPPSTPGQIVLNASTQPANQTSQILKDNPAGGSLTLRVAATYLDQTAASLDITLNYNLAGGKIICP
jgi:hypothetical protein